jgi:hypothetical protein
VNLSSVMCATICSSRWPLEELSRSVRGEKWSFDFELLGWLEESGEGYGIESSKVVARSPPSSHFISISLLLSVISLDFETMEETSGASTLSFWGGWRSRGRGMGSN